VSSDLHKADGRDPRQQGLKQNESLVELEKIAKPMGEIHDNKD